MTLQCLKSTLKYAENSKHTREKEINFLNHADWEKVTAEKCDALSAAKVTQSTEDIENVQQNKKEKGKIRKIITWFGRQKELIRNSTKKYGARQELDETETCDKYTVSQALVMASCGR